MLYVCTGDCAVTLVCLSLPGQVSPTEHMKRRAKMLSAGLSGLCESCVCLCVPVQVSG